MKIVVFGQALIHEPVDWSAELRALTRDADAVICNFEGCLPPPGAWPMKTKTVHAAHPEALDMLRDLGVTHLALANNHAWDFGHVGVIETRRLALERGFAVSGTGVSLAEATTPAVRNDVALLSVDAGPTPDWAIAGASPGVAPLRMIRTLGLPGRDVSRLKQIAAETGEADRHRNRMAVGYDAGSDRDTFYGLRITEAAHAQEIWAPDPVDLARLKEGIREARKTAALVVVALHYHNWASDWAQAPDWLLSVGESLVTAGADAVVCTGPPFAYDIQRHGQAVVAPGLGNLAFHTRRGPVYDRLGLPVWQGQALVLDRGGWNSRVVEVAKPSPGQGHL